MRLGLLLLASALVPALAPAAWAEPRLTIVAHASARGETLTSRDLADIFLKRRRYWASGRKIVPLEREPGSPERERFNRRYLGRSELELAEHWIVQKQVNGLVQPLRIDRPELLLALLRRTAGAIGYALFDDAERARVANDPALQLFGEPPVAGVP